MSIIIDTNFKSSNPIQFATAIYLKTNYFDPEDLKVYFKIFNPKNLEIEVNFILYNDSSEIKLIDKKRELIIKSNIQYN